MDYNNIVMNNKRQNYLLLCCTIQSNCIKTSAGAIKITKDSLSLFCMSGICITRKKSKASKHITGMRTVKLQK